MIACIRGCRRTRWHRDDCADLHCRGCLPRDARHGMLCDGCHNRIHQAVTQIPAIRLLLLAHLAPPLEQGELVRGHADPPAPLNIAVLDVLRDIDVIPGQWARLYAEERDLAGPDPDVRSVSVWLATHLAGIECAPWVDDLYRELLGAPEPDASWPGGLMVRAAQLTPWRQQAIRLGAPCPECHTPALIMYGGDDWVTCRECDAIVPRRLYEHWARVVLQEKTHGQHPDHERGGGDPVGGPCNDPVDGAPGLPHPREAGDQAPAVP